MERQRSRTVKGVWSWVRDEGGAATVDWIVLTAAVLFLGIGVVLIIRNAATDMTTGTGARLSDATLQPIVF